MLLCKFNRIDFKVKTGYKLELLSSETITLLRSTKKMLIKINTKMKDVPKLESVEVVLVHCNLVNSNYQQASKALLTFASNKQFGQNHYCTSFINNAKHNKYRIFFY